MLRWLLAVPVAVVVVVALFSFMATMIDYRQVKPLENSAPLSFDMLMLEPEQAVQPRKRSVPKPPQQPPIPPETASAAANIAQVNSATNPITAIAMANDFNFNIELEGVAIAAPNLGQIPLATPQLTSQQAMPLYRIEPNYPSRALKRKIEGYVILSFTIDPQGSVTDLKVIESQPRQLFEREALRALRQWKYQPKIEAGKALSQPNQTVKLEFRLEQ